MAVVGNSGGGVVGDLPNLKIEIDNDMDHRMETDDDGASVGKDPESSEAEEGELVDDDDRLVPANKKSVHHLNAVPTGRSILKYDTKEYVEFQEQSNSVKNPNGAFVTGLDIFSPEEQAKLDKRAKRFGIGASEGKVLNEKLLKKLYKSMGVKPTDEHVRAEALHMRGTEQMTTQEVFSYFKDYGPASLEWISDNSCNVVWLDSVSAARALLGLSVHVAGQAQTRSDSDVEMESQATPQEADDNLSEESDAVPLTELGANPPPGRWRRGAPHPLSPCPLLRFATTSDRSLPRPGFAKYGSHQFGGYVGLISESRKRRLQNTLPSPMLFEDVGDEAIPKPAADETDNANPWGVLAKTWSQFDKARKPRPPSPLIERILPMPAHRMTPPPSPPVFSSGRLKLVARRRERPERRRESEGERAGDSSDPEEWSSRSKVPRMRMHADDEERKVEKRLKKSHRNGSVDLRTRIGIERRYSAGEESPLPDEAEEEEEIPDLRVAVAADPSPETEEQDTKTGIRLFQTGNVKSVLRGARGYDENDEDDEEEVDEEEDDDDHGGRVRSSVRRHRSRSREKRRHHRRHHKESSYHRSRRRDTDSDDMDNEGKTMRSTIRKKSPEKKDSKRTKSGEHKSHDSRERSSREDREKRSPRHERRRDDERIKSEVSKKSERKRHGESRSSRDLRSKIVKSSTFDQENMFRSKSPLRIEIDNDEYYRQEHRD